MMKQTRRMPRLSSRRGLGFLLIVGLVASGLFPVGASVSADPWSAAQGGDWSNELGDWPFVPLHAALTAEGQLLTYGLDGQQRVFDTWNPAIDPTDETVDPADPRVDMTDQSRHTTKLDMTGSLLYCSITVSDATSNGLMILGGTRTNEPEPGEPDVEGPNNNFALRYRDGNISKLAESEQMHFPRWYPSATTLWDGRILVQGGTDNETPSQGGNAIVTPEIFDGTSWKLLAGATSEFIYGLDDVDAGGQQDSYNYPRTWITPAGKIFGVAGPNMYYINPEGNGAIELLGKFPSPVRGAASAAVMFDEGMVLQVGGQGGKGAVIVDLNTDPPTIRPTTSMHHARTSADATVLPDGRVLVSGGSNGWLDTTDIAYAPEIWDPISGLWTEMNPNSTPRLYHSAAVLLPDATVWTGGGGAPGPFTNLNAEIFYPPYLFKANGERAVQATIDAAPQEVGYGTAHHLTMSVPVSADVRLALVRHGNSTHSTNSQTWQELTVAADHQPGNLIRFTGPEDGFVAPPGDYMIYAIGQSGVPSQAALVKVKRAAVTQPPADGPVDPPDHRVPRDPVRVVNSADTTAGFLNRSAERDSAGVWRPAREVVFQSLVNPRTLVPRTDWRSLQWEFLPAGDGLYRIRNRWAPEDTAYVTRLARFESGRWVEQPAVRLEAYNAGWGSQKWKVERSGDGFVITNHWHSETGVLMYDEQNRLALGALDSGPPQIWLLNEL